MRKCAICFWPIPDNSAVIDYCDICGATVADERELRRIADQYSNKAIQDSLSDREIDDLIADELRKRPER